MSSIIDFLSEHGYMFSDDGEYVEKCIFQDKEHIICAIVIIKNYKYLVFEKDGKIISYKLNDIYKCYKSIVNDRIFYEIKFSTNQQYIITFPIHLEYLICDALSYTSNCSCFIWT